MELKALILLDPTEEDNPQPPETFAGIPFACLDVLGATVVERVTMRLRGAGISQISLISSVGPDAQTQVERSAHRARVAAVPATKDSFWQSAEGAFEQFRKSGADLILVLRVGAYVELDYEELIQHHIDKRCRMTSVNAGDGEALGVFVVDASRRGDATTLLRSRLQTVRDDCERFVATGYVNRLRSVAEFRRLAIDGLLERNAIRPLGKELKPGVWAGEGAQIHRKARILAPAYIGVHSKVRAAALVTRNSVIEHHSEVDCGTVVENSTILPFTYIGAGLDVMHSVVGFRRVAHLARDIAVEIHDPKLVGTSPTEALFRKLGSAAALFNVLPKRIYRGFLGRVRKIRPTRLPESLEAPAANSAKPDVNESASGQEVRDFPSSFAVVRRYGEH